MYSLETLNTATGHDNIAEQAGGARRPEANKFPKPTMRKGWELNENTGTSKEWEIVDILFQRTLLLFAECARKKERKGQ